MYGGITRSVLLHTLPAAGGAYLDFLGVLPLNTTHVNVSIALSGGAPGRLETVRIAFDGANTSAATLLAPGGGGGATAGPLAVPAARPWHPTSPALHTLTAKVAASGDGATTRFGLRTVGVTADGALTNLAPPLLPPAAASPRC